MNKDKKMDKNEFVMKLRHSLAHIMAFAVKKLYPETKIAIGPAIDDGFYYDFDFKEKITEGDLKTIEKEMINIINKNLNFAQKDISTKDALELFEDQPYKIELINDLNLPQVSLYYLGEIDDEKSFVDLCAGPHIDNTKEVPRSCFMLRSVAGAYWRGDEKNPMLTRIYSYAFTSQAELKDYLQYLEDVKQRDHRKIGKDLELFSFHQQAGEGLMYWHPNGGYIRSKIENFWKEEHEKNGYTIIYTPHIGKSYLWETSGHLNFYKDSMYSPLDIDGDKYYLKPMNCPFHLLIYGTYPRTYKELPIRYNELGTVYRYERSGTLSGSFRVRGFTQDDAHIICREDQVEKELEDALRFSLKILKTFGFNDFEAFISTKPDGHIGTDEMWTFTQEKLENALKNNNIKYGFDIGGGAFYGPKIDIKVNDSLGRQWQLSTIQFDFNLPEKFDIKYIDKDSKEKTPYMVHRALLGSIERFFGILVEHYKGRFPIWLSYEQVCIIPIKDEHIEYAKSLDMLFKSKGFKSVADLSDNRLNAKIRTHATISPFIIVVGDKETQTDTLSVKQRGTEEQLTMSKNDFVDFLLKKIENKE